MPMKKDLEINNRIYDAYIFVGSDRLYDLTKNGIFVEAYRDQPSVSPVAFWRDYAYSGEADKWFPQIDPDTIIYKSSSGQYDIGTNVYAYGRLVDSSKELIQEIRDELAERKLLEKHNSEIDKKIKALEKTMVTVPRQLYFDY